MEKWSGKENWIDVDQSKGETKAEGIENKEASSVYAAGTTSKPKDWAK
jgi:hypothetical protein